MITVQYRNNDGTVVGVQGTRTDGTPGPVPLPREGYTNQQVDAIPPGPGKLLWQNDALARVVPTPTPQQAFDAAVAAGYTVPGITPPLVLDLGESARAQFTGLVVLLDKLMSGGQLLATATQALADKSGNLHALPVAQIEGILLGYGAYYAGLYNTLHAAAAPASPA